MQIYQIRISCLAAAIGSILSATSVSGLSQTISAAGDRQLRSCVSIPDNARRLTCFDTAMTERSVTQSQSAPSPAASERDVTANPPDARPAVAAVRPIGPSFRIAAGYGFGVGDHAGAFRLVRGGRLVVDSGLGSSGGGVIAQVWVDGWIADDISLGLEYFEIHNRGKTLIDLPHGLSILTDPVTGGTDVDVLARLGALDVAWRPSGLGLLQPKLGVGIVAGRGEASYHAGLANDFFGSVSDAKTATTLVGGLQGFTGVDVELGDFGYLALSPRVVWLSGHPFGKDQRYLDFIIGTNWGIHL